MSNTADTLLLIDTHVHVYSCFDVQHFFQAAAKNFAQASAGEPFVGVLLLTETAREDWFAHLAAHADFGDAIAGTGAAAWRAAHTSEPESVRIDGPHESRVFCVAGRQLVTRERLEVSALGTTAPLPDGAGLADTVAQVRRVGAVPVLPWGLGKWWGRRGAALRTLLAAASPTEVWLGDSGGRPGGLGEPAHFREARRRGIGILQGTDPLPLAREAARPGSFGVRLSAAFDAAAPWQSIRRLLADPACRLTPFGRLASPWRVALNQAHLRLRRAAG